MGEHGDSLFLFILADGALRNGLACRLAGCGDVFDHRIGVAGFFDYLVSLRTATGAVALQISVLGAGGGSCGRVRISMPEGFKALRFLKAAYRTFSLFVSRLGAGRLQALSNRKGVSLCALSLRILMRAAGAAVGIASAFRAGGCLINALTEGVSLRLQDILEGVGAGLTFPLLVAVNGVGG